MKVVCIYNGNYYITIGKIYDVIDETNYTYDIINDRGFVFSYEINCFKSASEIRNEKINKLLEE